jgi:hypothetical protein
MYGEKVHVICILIFIISGIDLGWIIISPDWKFVHWFGTIFISYTLPMVFSIYRKNLQNFHAGQDYE